MKQIVLVYLALLCLTQCSTQKTVPLQFQYPGYVSEHGYDKPTLMQYPTAMDSASFIFYNETIAQSDGPITKLIFNDTPALVFRGISGGPGGITNPVYWTVPHTLYTRMEVGNEEVDREQMLRRWKEIESHDWYNLLDTGKIRLNGVVIADSCIYWVEVYKSQRKAGRSLALLLDRMKAGIVRDSLTVVLQDISAESNISEIRLRKCCRPSLHVHSFDLLEQCDGPSCGARCRCGVKKLYSTGQILPAQYE